MSKLTSDVRLEIAEALAKHFLAKELHLRDIGDLRRGRPNMAKQLGVSSCDLRVFMEEILREIFDKQIITMNS